MVPIYTNYVVPREITEKSAIKQRYFFLGIKTTLLHTRTCITSYKNSYILCLLWIFRKWRTVSRANNRIAG